MDFSRILEQIESAHGNTDALALATVDLVIASQPPSEQDDLRVALDAASVVHWFDPQILSALLDLEPDGKHQEHLFNRLTAFPFVERYASRGPLSHNVHQATRLPWRTRLHRHSPQRLQDLSERAAAIFPIPTDRTAPAQLRIEAVYLRLTGGNSSEARDMCREIGTDWRTEGRLQESQALALALEELDQCDILNGATRAACLLEIAEARWPRLTLEEKRRLVDRAHELASAEKDDLLQGHALAIRVGCSTSKALNRRSRCLRPPSSHLGSTARLNRPTTGRQRF
jgi:hypothetical protein